MKRILSTVVLIAAAAGATLALPCGPDFGQTNIFISSQLQQIYGTAGTGPTFTSFLLQGFIGVEMLCADNVRLESNRLDLNGNIYWNGRRLVMGPSNSAGRGYRILMVENTAAGEQ